MTRLFVVAVLAATAGAGFVSTSAGAMTVPHGGVRVSQPGAESAATRGSVIGPEIAAGDPSQSLPPNPDFSGDGSCEFSALDNSTTCNEDVVQATNHARAVLESLPSLSLSLAAYEAMTVPEQLFVIANMERLARGVAPMAGLTAQLDTIAQTGADTNADPSFPPQLTGGAEIKGGGSNYAAGTTNPLGSNYYWMYDDGYGGINGDCPSPGAPGCWGHRDDILLGLATASICNSWGLPGVQDYMGAGFTPSGSAYGPSFAEIFIGACGSTPTDVVFTWTQALQLLDAATISSVTPARGPVTGGQTVTVTGSGFAVGMSVTIGGAAVTPFSISATSFSFTTPREAAGMAQVQVTTSSGPSALTPADVYSYGGVPVISALTPSAGPVTGGQVVRVTGSGFVAGMTATIGGTTVTPSSITASAFTFTAPAKSAGYDQVRVTNLAGASALTPLAGYIYTGLGSYVPLTPFRILDTRSGLCGVRTCPALGTGQTLALQITGYTDARTGESVPANATAVVLNVLAVNGSAPSLLTVYPSGTGRPLASNLNFNAHTNIANLVTVALGQAGSSDSQREVSLYNALGTVNVVVDVEGYFVPQASSNPAGEFHAMAPLRVCDTRTGQPGNGCNLGHSTDNEIGPGQVLKVNVTGIPSGVSGSPASIPTDGSAGAAVLNLTAVAGTRATWLSVVPTQSNGTCLAGAPGSSTINVSAGGVQANRVMVPLGPGHSGGPSTDVCVYNAAGTINAILDASGWFGSATGSPPTGAQYQAIGPTRICDTRSGTGTLCSGRQVTAGGTLLVAVAGVGGIPGSGPVAIVATLTAVSGSQPTYLTVYPADMSPKPNASDVNVNAGTALPNLVEVGLASGAHPGGVNLFNAMGSINAVLDVDGWFQ